MERIIKSTEVPTGNLTSAQRAYMFNLNMNPEFDATDKSWTFHQVMTTDTECVPWLISIGEEYFVAIGAPPPPRGAHQVTFYPAHKAARGNTYKYKISLKTMVDRLNCYVDMEAACDEFAKRHYQAKLG